MEKFNLGDEFIELNKLLKVLSWVGTGGEAKNAIDQGLVVVNGEVETRRRKKIRVGDLIKYGDEEARVVEEY